MFKSKKSFLGKSVETFASIIGQGMRVEGDLVIFKSLRIDGSVNGCILQPEDETATVAIAPEATVVGDITVHNVIISGTVKGNIVSTGRVELIESAMIVGNITYGSIGIAIGARVSGHLKQIEDKAQYAAIDAISVASQSRKRIVKDSAG